MSSGTSVSLQQVVQHNEAQATPKELRKEGGAYIETDTDFQTSTDVQADMIQLQILKALRNIIVPLLHEAVTDDELISMRSEGAEFLGALQTFITCVIDSRSSNQREGITIDLKESSPNAVQGDSIAVAVRVGYSVGLEVEEFGSNAASMVQDISGIPKEVIMQEDKMLDSFSPERALSLTPLEKVREALRQNVFNVMPIRMLFSQMHGSEFTITLAERGTIFGYLLPKLDMEFDETQFLSDLSTIHKRSQSATYAEEQVITKWVAKVARYAILSHTWLRLASGGEITYGQWRKGGVGLNAGEPGYEKLVNFCRVAADEYGIALGWMDTVCINKESSAELDESIRSMFKWYQKAYLCITYLAETVSLSEMHNDPWFSRGWTLQELLAPDYTKFYGREWARMIPGHSNDKTNPKIQREIERATTITALELNYILYSSMSRKMQWAAMREVTREEDAAYSVMGIFSVSIPIAYGEGAKQAFFRLLKEILSSARDDVMELFYWAGSYSGTISTLLPSSPKAYLHAGENDTGGLALGMPIEPLTLTHLGLRVPILLMPAVLTMHANAPFIPVGEYYATVDISLPIGDGNNAFSYNLLDSNPMEPPGGIVDEQGSKIAFGVLNFGGGEGTVHIRKTCFAVALNYSEDGGKVKALGSAFKMETKIPVVFELERVETTAGGVGDDPSSDEQVQRSYYTIPKGMLAEHGIQLLNLYL